MTMRRVYQITAILIFLPSLWLLRAAIELHYYTPMGPGPGFFPLWLALILGLLAILMFADATFGASGRRLAATKAELLPERDGQVRLVAILVALAVTTALLERLGFGLTMFFMNAAVLWTLGTRRPITLICVALAGSFGVEFVFTHWLNVPLPATDWSLICPTGLCGE